MLVGLQINILVVFKEFFFQKRRKRKEMNKYLFYSTYVIQSRLVNNTIRTGEGSMI